MLGYSELVDLTPLNLLCSALLIFLSEFLLFQERDDQILELSAAMKEKQGGSAAQIFPSLLECDGPRRSRRIASSQKHSVQHEHAVSDYTIAELAQIKAELEQCKAELDLKQTELTLKTLGKIKYSTLDISVLTVLSSAFLCNKSSSYMNFSPKSNGNSNAYMSPSFQLCSECYRFIFF